MPFFAFGLVFVPLWFPKARPGSQEGAKIDKKRSKNEAEKCFLSCGALGAPRGSPGVTFGSVLVPCWLVFSIFFFVVFGGVFSHALPDKSKKKNRRRRTEKKGETGKGKQRRAKTTTERKEREGREKHKKRRERDEKGKGKKAKESKRKDREGRRSKRKESKGKPKKRRERGGNTCYD